jgi:hypothetical protein
MYRKLFCKVSLKERGYIKSPVELRGLVVLLVIFFSFSTYIPITFHLTTVFIKNLINGLT